VREKKRGDLVEPNKKGRQLRRRVGEVAGQGGGGGNYYLEKCRGRLTLRQRIVLIRQGKKKDDRHKEIQRDVDGKLRKKNRQKSWRTGIKMEKVTVGREVRNGQRGEKRFPQRDS